MTQKERARGSRGRGSAGKGLDETAGPVPTSDDRDADAVSAERRSADPALGGAASADTAAREGAAAAAGSRERASADAASSKPGSAETVGDHAAAADETPVDTSSGPGGDADAARARVSSRTARAVGVAFIALLALAFGVVATGVSGFLWWQYRQFYVSLDEADAESRRALEDLRARTRRVEDSLDAVDSESTTQRRALDELDQALELIPPRLAALDQRIDAVQGGSLDARSQWLKAEAEYYLATANAELNIAGRWEGAVTALELADQLLVELGDPALGQVRAAIAGELIALRSVRLPDTEGLAFGLGRLAERIPDLPLREDLPDNFASDEAALEDAEPGLGRLWLGMRQALSGILRVERRDETVRPALSEAERSLVRRQLAVELELARVALLRGEQQSFETSLSVASGILRAEFDADAPPVEGALGLLSEMAEIDVAPALPDISRSLNRLRAAGTEEN
jgi:uroporphyrin-3 C-methyltransferase